MSMINRSILLLVKRIDESDNLIHIALSMLGPRFTYSIVCDAPHDGVRVVSHRKGSIPTCLQCIGQLTVRYFHE